MATTYHLYLRKDKKRSSGECPIYLRITQNRKSRYVSTGVYVNPKDWNEEKEEVRKTHSNHKSLNSILKREQSKAENIQDELGAHGKDSAKAIQRRIKAQRSSDFFDLAEEYHKDLEDRKRLYAIKNLGVMLNKLEAFEGERSLSIKDIDTHYLERFEGFLKRRYNNRSTTINKNFEPLKEIIRKALNEHLITENPFQGFKGAKRGRPEPKVKLTIEQINAIEDLDLEKDSNLWHTRNYFMFSFYSAGIRFGDMCCLKWSDIKGDRLSYQMNKNEKVFTVELNEHQHSILALYKSKNDSELIFPILNEHQDLLDPILLRNQIGSKNALINKWLKRICELVNEKIKKEQLEIPKLEGVSFHVARHSFAQYAVGKGLSIYEVMQTLRHSKIETTQKYLKGLDEELADKAMKKVF